MVDQATVKSASNGQEAPPQAVARTGLEFLNELITLGELQLRLLGVEVQEGRDRALAWIVMLVGGLLIALSCLPLCLIAMALCMVEFWHWSMPVAFGTLAGLGLLTAAILMGLGYFELRKASGTFDRSYHEWGQNVRWFKETLRRLSATPSRDAKPSRTGLF